MPIFEVDNRGTRRLIEAPNVVAAVIYMGEFVGEEDMWSTAVFAQDGKPYKGLPFWIGLEQLAKAGLINLNNANLSADLTLCRFAEPEAMNLFALKQWPQSWILSPGMWAISQQSAHNMVQVANMLKQFMEQHNRCHTKIWEELQQRGDKGRFTITSLFKHPDPAQETLYVLIENLKDASDGMPAEREVCLFTDSEAMSINPQMAEAVFDAKHGNHPPDMTVQWIGDEDES